MLRANYFVNLDSSSNAFCSYCQICSSNLLDSFRFVIITGLEWWFVAVEETLGGKRREIELVVGGEDEVEEDRRKAPPRLSATVLLCKRRRRRRRKNVEEALPSQRKVWGFSCERLKDRFDYYTGARDEGRVVVAFKRHD